MTSDTFYTVVRIPLLKRVAVLRRRDRAEEQRRQDECTRWIAGFAPGRIWQFGRFSILVGPSRRAKASAS